MYIQSPSSLVGFTLFTALVGCSAAGSSTTQPMGQNDQECSLQVSGASEKISAVIEANQSCTQDQDCISVELGAGCFDSCGRVMGVSGKPAYEKAVADADATFCSVYAAHGCPKVMPPPCVAPPPATCKAGKCG